MCLYLKKSFSNSVAILKVSKGAKKKKEMEFYATYHFLLKFYASNILLSFI